jgi:putative DNA-invertase from lambdoid prophage Rac
MARAGIWLRVPIGHQDSDNQLPDIEAFTEHHGHSITARYEVSEMAWHGGREFRATLEHALDDARAGRFSLLIIWALDQITREGAEGALRVIRQFRERGCIVVSVKESWLNAPPEAQEVLAAFAEWMTHQQSARRSERIKAGLARRRAEGKPVGRQPGAVDRGPRKRSGYYERWERERAATS